MKKAVIVVGAIIVVAAGLVCIMFAQQYNSKGISGLLAVTIDENQPKEYVGELDGYNIYVEKLKTDELYFISIGANEIPLKDAVDKKLVSIKDWRKKAWEIRKDGEAEILQYENYEIVITNDDCVFRPISSYESNS